MGASQTVPYCGAPPSPDGLWGRWNLDPILLTALALGLAVYWIATRQETEPPWRRRAFLAGWLILSAALVSPLCPLSVSLFSARVSQHMILSLVAAPLLVLGHVGQVFRRLLGLAPRSPARLAWPPSRVAIVATLCFAVAIWFWHAPGPYDATFTSPLAYWVMHLTVVGSALMVWSVLLDARRDRTTIALASGAVSTVQMTLLGALITLTPHRLYAPHILTPYAWGLTQASDQQLGGLIMWVPGCTIFLGVTLIALGRAMSDPSHPNALA